MIGKNSLLGSVLIAEEFKRSFVMMCAYFFLNIVVMLWLRIP